MSSVTTPDSQTRPRIVIAGAGPAAQALVRQLTRTPFAGGITVLSNRDDAPAELLELAALPQVSLRFGQPVSYIDPDGQRVTTADGLEFTYDQLVIATGSSPAGAPLEGAGRCLSYSTIDDANGLGEAVKDVTRVLGRRPLGILVGTGTAAGQAEAVLRARGVRPVRTTLRPAAVVPNLAGSMLPAAGVIFEDGSSMNGDLVVLAEERIARDALSVSAGLKTAPRGGIVIGEDFRTSVPGIWAIGDAAVFDGVRLGLLVAAASAASVCASQLLRATLSEPLADAA
ncbi:NAD(P)/FAD-dependent oxidoreductase [Pseudarthrobacter sp. MM222]|uniref:NAD(P)/FAD-dependent oxidoreductase n=1 Tax=Pseudarthrobacter sp. MM222 TaxID=3018929 RepID=UPI002220A381|nr:NAD(P)/FAD-dependent oxidoreductase [Pseudarthrobacter sp. MM222]CAI3794941.1 3-phenylpropionate/cinnamic acid dioxygenase ferredoxin--NAD(+) reductase component [Pseudarthrobacter sp. MM222]